MASVYCLPYTHNRITLMEENMSESHKTALQIAGYCLGIATMIIGGQQTNAIKRLTLCAAGWVLCQWTIRTIETGRI